MSRPVCVQVSAGPKPCFGNTTLDCPLARSTISIFVAFTTARELKKSDVLTYANLRPSGAHATGLKVSSASVSAPPTILLASLPSARISQISTPCLPNKNATFEPSGETLADAPASASFLGVPPITDISQRLGGFLGSSTHETTR